MSKGKVTVIARMKAIKGKEEELGRELIKLLAPSRKDHGCINYDLHLSCDDSSLFIFHENWESSEALNKHLETPHLISFKAMAVSLLSEPPEVIVCKNVEEL